MNKFTKSQRAEYLKPQFTAVTLGWAGKPVGPAIRDQRDPAFYPKTWVCKSAPFIISLNKHPAAGRELLFVCLPVPHSAGLVDKELLGLRVCKDQLARPPFKIYSFCALFNPDAQKAICCFIVGLHFF